MSSPPYVATLSWTWTGVHGQPVDSFRRHVSVYDSWLSCTLAGCGTGVRRLARRSTILRVAVLIPTRRTGLSATNRNWWTPTSPRARSIDAMQRSLSRLCHGLGHKALVVVVVVDHTQPMAAAGRSAISGMRI